MTNARPQAEQERIFIGLYCKCIALWAARCRYPFVHGGLAEAAGNLLDAPYTEARVGRRVEVVFQPLNDDITLPQFRLAA